MATFITYKDLLEQVNASPTQCLFFHQFAYLTDRKSGYPTLYESCSQSWIFAFVSVLNFVLWENSDEELTKLIEINDLCIRIEEWILEHPEFLHTFAEQKQQEVRTKTPDELQRAYARREALHLIMQQQEERFLSDIHRKISVAGIHMLDRELRMQTFINLFLYSPEAIGQQADNFISAFQLIVSENIIDPGALLQPLMHKLYKEQKKNNRLMTTEQLDAEIRLKSINLIRFIGVECLINRKLEMESDMYLRCTFYRYLCILSERHPEVIKNMVFNTLLSFGGPIPEFSWNDLCHFSLEQFVEKVSHFTDSYVGEDKVSIYQGKGKITVMGKQITVEPRQTSMEYRRLSNHVHCLDGAIEIRSRYKSKINTSTCTDLLRLGQHWENVLEDYKEIKHPTPTVIKKERPPAGMLLKVKVKNFAPTLPMLAFVSIVDDQYEGRGVLHASQVSRIKLNTLVNVFQPGDMMMAKVQSVNNDKMSFTLLDPLGKFIGSRNQSGEHIPALLVARKDNLLIWCTEGGFPVYTPNVPDMHLDIGDIYMLVLNQVFPNGYIQGRVEYALADVRIDPQSACVELIKDYVERQEQVDEAEEMETDAPVALPPDYIYALIHTIDLYSTSQFLDYPAKFNLLYCARLFSNICGDEVLSEFYQARINYMQEIYRFTTGRECHAEVLSEETIKKFPRLTKARLILSILRHQDPLNRLNELTAYLRSEQRQVATMARLLLSRDLLSTYPRLVEQLNAEILSLLSFNIDETEPEEEINFGRENNTREFKSSVVYPPDANWTADVDRQMGNILVTICGFLNAQGGTLYIGVNDAGYPQGIEMDLRYLQCNEDKYQLLLRRYIVEHLGKDINSLLVVDFHSYDKKTVCAVSVPPYHEIVTYKGTVWQRQGNATRKLESGDLKLFRMRKKYKINSTQAASPEFPEEVTEATTNEINSDLRMVALQNKKNGEGETITLIPTSQLKPPVEADQPIAYFSILQSGKFMISSDVIYRKDIRLTLPLYEENQTDYLLQIYANGYVNRVAISTLLKKKLDYEYTNALFTKSTIIFIGIASKDDYIYLQIRHKGEDYIKILPLKRIKINLDLSLKGTPLVDVPFDQIVRTDILSPKLAEELKDIENDTVTSLGSKVTSQSVIQEVHYLKELFELTEALDE